MAINPFVWQDAIADPARIVGMDDFARVVARRLKGHTNVALFGPRGTGKTTFTVKLAEELARSHGPDGPPHDVVYVSLQWAFSVPAVIAAVTAGMRRNPSLRRSARAKIANLEKQFGINLGVVRASVRGGPRSTREDEQVLYQQLVAVRELSRHLVVVFDEFQRLNSCPGHPLAVIRDAFSGVDAAHVSMLFTGSIREALEMMLARSDEPLFQQAVPMSLPPIDREAFEDFLDLSFSSTGKPAAADALEFLLNSTGGHPRRTQQLAWQAWEQTAPGAAIDAPAIETALASAVAMSGVGDELATLIAEDGNLARVLSIVAERPAGEISRDQLHRHGLSHWSTATRALERLRLRGLVERREDGWHLCDPFVAEWLRANSPFGAG